MKKLIFSLFILGLLGCSKPAESNRDSTSPSAPTSAPVKTDSEGAADIGGADIILSSEAEVHAAIDSALAFIHLQAFLPEGYGNFAMIAKKSQNPLVKEVLFPTVTIEPEEDQEEEMASKTKHLSAVLQKSKINRLPKGPCPGENGRHPVASVSAHTIGADICLSIEKLQEISAKALERQIISLIVHEVAHLLGHREKEARMVQEEVYEQLLAQELSFDTPTVKSRFTKSLTKAKRNLLEAKLLITNSKANDRVPYLISDALANMSVALPGYNDRISFYAFYYKNNQNFLHVTLKEIRLASHILIFYFTNELERDYDDRISIVRNVTPTSHAIFDKNLSKQDAISLVISYLEKALIAVEDLK